MPRALSLVIPEGLVVLAAVALAKFGAALPGFAQVAEWLPGIVLLAGLALAWRSARGRLLAGLLVTSAFWAWVVAGSPVELTPPLAVALVLTMTTLAWGRERRFGGWPIGVALLGLVGIAVFALLLSVFGYPAGAPVVGAFAWTGLADWAGGALVLGLLGTLAAAVLRSDGIAQGALWATVAGWGALVLEERPGALVLVAGAMAALVTGTLEALYSAAYRDALTGLPSRRALDERLEGLPVGVVVAMIDVDHFKQFNDTHGHDTGDQVLRMVAWRLAEVPDGEAFRYGGEEFTLVFDGLAPADALARLEGARQAVAACRFLLRSGDRPKGKQGKARRGREEVRHGLSVTISIGAAVRKDGEQAASLLKRADEALYSAKEAGRDRVHSAR